MSVEDASDVVFEEENLRFLQLGRISERTVHAAAQREPHAVISLAHLVQGRLAGQAQDDHCSSGVLWQNHCVAVAPMNVLLLATANQLVRLPLAETLAAAQQYQKPETLREDPFPKLDVVQLQRLGTQTVTKSEPIDVATFGAILDLQVSADGAVVAVNTNAGRSLIYAMADLRLVFTLPSTYDRLWCWIPRTPSSAIVTRKIDRCPVFLSNVFRLTDDSASAFVLDAAETQALTLVAAGDVLLSIVFSNHEWLCLRFALRRSLETPNIVTAIEKLDQISLQTPGGLRQVCRLQPLSESESLIAFTEAESLTVPPDAVQFALVRLPPVHTSQQSVSSTSQVTCFRAPHWIILGEVCPIFMDAADDLSRWISYLVAVPEWRLCVCALAPSDELELVGDSHWGQSSPAWRILRISDDFRAQLPEFDNSEWVRILGMDCFYDCPEESADKIAAFEPVLVVFTNNGLLHWLRIRGRASAGRAHDQQRVLNRAPIPELVTDLVHGNPATPTSLALDTEHPQKSSSDVFMEHAPPRVDMSLSEATSAADGRRFDRVSLDGSVVERPQANAMIPDRDCNQQSVLSAGMERVEVGASTKIADATTFSASYTPASPASARLRSPATNPSPEVERSLPDLRAVLRIVAAENERSQDQQDNDDTDDGQSILRRIQQQQRTMIQTMVGSLQQFERLVRLLDVNMLERSISKDSLKLLREDPLGRLQEQCECIHEYMRESKQSLHECASSLGFMWTRLPMLESQMHQLLGETTTTTDDELISSPFSNAKRFAQHLRQIEHQSAQVQKAANRLQRWLAILEETPPSPQEHARQSVALADATWYLRHQYGERLRQIYESTFRCTMSIARLQREWEALAARAQQVSELLRDETLPASRLALHRILDQKNEENTSSMDDAWNVSALSTSGAMIASATPSASDGKQLFAESTPLPKADRTRTVLVHRLRQAIRRQALAHGRDSIGRLEAQTISGQVKEQKAMTTSLASGQSLEPPNTEHRSPNEKRHPPIVTQSSQTSCSGTLSKAVVATLPSVLPASEYAGRARPTDAIVVSMASSTRRPLGSDEGSHPQADVAKSSFSSIQSSSGASKSQQEVSRQGMSFDFGALELTREEPMSLYTARHPTSADTMTENVMRGADPAASVLNESTGLPSKPTAPASKLNHQAEAPKHLLQASRVAENPKQDSALQRGTADDRTSLELVTSTLQHALASTQTEPSTPKSTKEEIPPRVAENKSTLEQHYPFRAESVTEAATATHTLGAKQSDIETARSTASRPETIRESANPMTSKPHGNGRDEAAQAPETIPRVPGPAMTSAMSKNLPPVQTPTPLEQTAPGSEPTPAAALRVADPSVHGASGPFFGMAGGIRDFQREPVSASSTSMMTTDQTRPVFGAPSALGAGVGFGNLPTGWGSATPTTAPNSTPITFGQSMMSTVSAPLTFGSLAHTSQSSMQSSESNRQLGGGFGAFSLSNQTDAAVGFAYTSTGGDQPNRSESSGPSSSWFGVAPSSMGSRRPAQSPAFTQRRA